MRSSIESLGADAVVCSHWADGGEGAETLVSRLVGVIKENGASFVPSYPDEMSLIEKIETVAKKVYRADRIAVEAKVRKKIACLQSDYGHFPVCMAKTQYSFSTDPKQTGAPSGHRIPVREVRLSAGAEFIVAICGEIMTMPGLPKNPSADRIHLDASGGNRRIVLGDGKHGVVAGSWQPWACIRGHLRASPGVRESAAHLRHSAFPFSPCRYSLAERG